MLFQYNYICYNYIYMLDKADKKAEQLRIEKMEQQRQDREDEIREMSLKLRRKYVIIFI